MKGKLRHLALATQDVEKTANFYKEAFGFEEVKRVDVDLGEAIILTDGTINITVARFRTDQLGKGLDYVGLHHFGVLVDDVEKASAEAVALGAQCLFDNPAEMKGSFEVKHVGPDGVVFDLSEHAWVGAKPIDQAA